MELHPENPLVSTTWLSKNLEREELVVLDASIPKPATDPKDNPLNSIQIPGSLFFDINNSFSDLTTPLPHMMANAEQFEREARKLGINKTSVIIVYDNLGIYASPRAWWMLKSMGHEEVYVLDGGLPKWVDDGLPVEKKKHTQIDRPGDFVANFQSAFFKGSQEVLEQLRGDVRCIVDARSAGRFNGTEPEPRAGLRGGHIPESVNLPFPEVLNGNVMKPKQELKDIFESLDLSDVPLTFTCGSGLTACIILLAAYVAGYQNLSVYDGSWSEWGMPSDLPVVR